MWEKEIQRFNSKLSAGKRTTSSKEIIRYLDIQQFTSGDHSKTAQSLNNLAAINVELGNYKGAELAAKEALVLHETNTPSDWKHASHEPAVNSEGRNSWSDPLYRDLQELSDLRLVELKDGKVRARRETVLFFLPDRVKLFHDKDVMSLLMQRVLPGNLFARTG